MLKIPASLSEDCKNLIVSLLNRNPSKRLGAGADGAEEIKRHVFFKDIDWQDVKQKKLQPPRPDVNMQYYHQLARATEVPDEQLLRVFDDIEPESEVFETRNVDGWSFVQPAGQSSKAGNQ